MAPIFSMNAMQVLYRYLYTTEQMPLAVITEQ